MRRVLPVLFLAACGRPEAPADRPLRLVLITLDTLRGDALAGGGDMPRLEERTRSGVRFTAHYAASSTTQPTHASLMTGLHPWEHGVTRNGVVLGAEHLTLAERLGRAGFATGAVVASFPLHRRFGFRQGFDRYEDDFTRGRTGEWSGVTTEAGGRFYSLAGAVNERAFALLDELSGARQFLWFHYFDAHEPYGDARKGEVLRLERILVAAEEDRGRAEELVQRARELYRADLERLDFHLGRLFRRLERDAERFETYVLVVSDHGESFGEAGALGHGTRLDPVQLRVPCVLFALGTPPRAAPVVDDRPTGSVDVHATLLALAGLQPDGHGRDLSVALGGRSRSPVASAEEPVTGMRRTYEHPFREPRLDGVARVLPDPWFYRVVDGRLVVGNGERVESRGGEVPAEVLDAARTSFGYLAERLAEGAGEEVLDPETRRALEALGYTR